MDNETKLESVQKFIFNDEVQSILSKINNNVMDFNILEITGMGNQEIKHSNILGWLFDNSEHNLEYQILDNFLNSWIPVDWSKFKRIVWTFDWANYKIYCDWRLVNSWIYTPSNWSNWGLDRTLIFWASLPNWETLNNILYDQVLTQEQVQQDYYSNYIN